MGPVYISTSSGSKLETARSAGTHLTHVTLLKNELKIYMHLVLRAELETGEERGGVTPMLVFIQDDR